MDPDNAFNEIFGKKPSTEQKTEPQNSLEDTSAIKEQSEAALQTYPCNSPCRKSMNLIRQRSLSASVDAGEKAMSVSMAQPLIRSATSLASVTKTSYQR